MGILGEPHAGGTKSGPGKTCRLLCQLTGGQLAACNLGWRGTSHRLWPALPVPPLPLLIVASLIPHMVLVQGVTAGQVVLQPKDVPAHAQIKSETHAIQGYGTCSSAYQSLYGSGLGGSEALVSVAYRCPSATDAAQLFPAFASFYEQYYGRPKWRYQLLPALKVGHSHSAWLNVGLPGTVHTSTAGRSSPTPSRWCFSATISSLSSR